MKNAEVGGVKRFYTAVTIADGQLLLDGKPVKTRNGMKLAHPSAALMQSVAGEWASRRTHINYQEMPLTRLLIATLELGDEQKQALVGHVLSYAPTDLLCYHSADDAALAVKQRDAWLPWLAWLEETHGATLRSTYGIMPVLQEAESLSRLRNHINSLSSGYLIACNELTAFLGSLVLALAVLEGTLPAADAFALSVLDETHQAGRWGEDEAAAQARTLKQQEIIAAAGFASLLSK